MIREKLVPEDNTMVSILSACSNLEIQEIERWVRDLSEFGTQDDKDGDVCCDSVDTVLVYLHGKWGKIDKSMEVFDKITDRGEAQQSVLPWNTIIGCYTQNSRPIEALCLFRLMVAESSPRPNHVTMVNVLSSCAQVGDLELGRWVYKYMKKNKGTKSLIETNTILATAFIDMYSKCGDLRGTIEVFDGMVIKDLVSFNAMIMGFAINGEGEEALKFFTKMEHISIHPNTGTFLGLLSTCNHSGLVDEGRQIFREMGQKYSDLVILMKLWRLLAPWQLNQILVWGALLGGCLVNSRFDVARDIAKRIVKANLDNSGGYVMLSNLYAKDGRWSKILELRGMMRERGVRKQPGCSWISIDGVVHEFLVGSTSHPQIQRIFCTLQGLFNEMSSMTFNSIEGDSAAKLSDTEVPTSAENVCFSLETCRDKSDSIAESKHLLLAQVYQVGIETRKTRPAHVIPKEVSDYASE
ncbi:Pentatricopeptide repeat [Macleaya cordata]|uniref:Pentatricopeptide repeat n=1 Tax=Macleaya cordata TaxID=56857 RepID=A0A200RCI2_MACCD|nr:Pentatricopeptide repeat [Macleaya cordata]